jgi:membrane-associated protease RseP (regulator of RpoE activity)
LVAGTAAIVVLLSFLAGWELPLVIGIILAIVMLHEFGHFFTAKRSGMLVTDYFVGFGPVLWSTTIGETRYGIRALPLGGFVKVPGMTWGDTIDPALESRTYRSASYPRKVIFASAGSFMHLVIAFALAWSSLVFIGTPQANQIGIAGFEVWQSHPVNAAQAAGLRTGDQLVSIDGHAITSMNAAIAEVRRHANTQITIVVKRQGRLVVLHATPQDGRHLRVDGVALATGATPQGFLGIQLQEQVEPTSWYAAVPKAVDVVGSTIAQAAHAMVHVFSPSEVTSIVHDVASPSTASSPAAQVTRPVSIVGVVRIADQAAQSNVPALLLILINLNIFVGLLNMLPMLPLDGGYVAIATYERLRRRRGEAYHADVNKLAPLVYVFVGALGLLFVSTLYLDLVAPLTNPFH